MVVWLSQSIFFDFWEKKKSINIALSLPPKKNKTNNKKKQETAAVPFKKFKVQAG